VRWRETDGCECAWRGSDPGVVKQTGRLDMSIDFKAETDPADIEAVRSKPLRRCHFLHAFLTNHTLNVCRVAQGDVWFQAETDSSKWHPRTEEQCEVRPRHARVCCLCIRLFVCLFVCIGVSPLKCSHVHVHCLVGTRQAFFQNDARNILVTPPRPSMARVRGRRVAALVASAATPPTHSPHGECSPAITNLLSLV